MGDSRLTPRAEGRPSDPFRVLAVVLNFNGGEDVLACLDSLEAQTGGPPNTFAGHAYDAIGMLKDALLKAGADDAAKLRDAIEQTTGFVGIQGVFTYSAEDHSGLTTKDVTLIEIEDSKWVPYEAEEQ